MGNVPHFIRRFFSASDSKRHAPIWAAQDPNSSTWAEILSVAPTIVHVWPTLGFPLGAASAVGPLFRDQPVHFLVTPSWTIEPPGASALWARAAAAYVKDHPKHRFSFLCNTVREAELMQAEGCAATVLNQNCLMDDAVYRPLPEVEPIYDAVYNGRLSHEKRNDLAREIDSLALVYFYDHVGGGLPSDFHAEYARLRALMPKAHFVNELTPTGSKWLGGKEVNRILAQSRVGLCLSPIEGAMRASIEYLLAGLPVVSTPSLGGRDYFFDDDFCLIVEPDPRSIREAVEALIARRIPRDTVRAKTLARVEAERDRYIGLVQHLIDKAGGTGRFEDRFRNSPRGKNWRPMSELADTLSQHLSGAKPFA